MPIEDLACSHSLFLFLNHKRHAPNPAETGSDPGYHHFLGTRGYFGQQPGSPAHCLSLHPRDTGGGEGTRSSPRFGEPTDVPITLPVSAGSQEKSCQMLEPRSAQLILEEIRSRFRQGLYIGLRACVPAWLYTSQMFMETP